MQFFSDSGDIHRSACGGWDCSNRPAGTARERRPTVAVLSKPSPIGMFVLDVFSHLTLQRLVNIWNTEYESSFLPIGCNALTPTKSERGKSTNGCFLLLPTSTTVSKPLPSITNFFHQFLQKLSFFYFNSAFIIVLS
ncbi:hypothetical protein L1887_09886 [Cichorium endivia]|nr:hypothetical protein L1887_09886 [Cichorium endivia]